MSSNFYAPSPVDLASVEERLDALYRRRTVVEALIRSLEDYRRLGPPPALSEASHRSGRMAS